MGVADGAVYAGRQLHAASACSSASEPLSVELTSTALGLTGKVDCLRRRDGSYLPYEHKRGQPCRRTGEAPSPWPSDRLQVIAYAVLLEEAFGQAISEGRIRYHAANVTVRVPIDEVASSPGTAPPDRRRP
jgi:CRISPR-associated protein Cas1